VGAQCEVTELSNGGATNTTIDPAGPVTITADQTTPVGVTVTIIFDVGSLRVIKQIDAEEGQVGDDQLFWFQLECQQMVNGESQAVPIENDGTFNLSIDGGLSQTFDDLPTGAVCTVTETDNGGADESVVEPGQVTVGDGTTVDVLATNTFDPPPDDPGGSHSDESLSNTGGPNLVFLAAGLALLLVGGSVLLLSLRRRS
jgi:large repetitive protein